MLAGDDAANEMGPDMESFAEDEARYLTYWRRWSKANVPPIIPSPIFRCAPISRRRAPPSESDTMWGFPGSGPHADDGTTPDSPVVPLASLADASETRLGRVLLKQVAVDGIATRIHEGAASYVLCLRDPSSGAHLGPESKVPVETWVESHRLRLLELEPHEPRRPRDRSTRHLRGLQSASSSVRHLVAGVPPACSDQRPLQWIQSEPRPCEQRRPGSAGILPASSASRRHGPMPTNPERTGGLGPRMSRPLFGRPGRHVE